MRGPDGRGRGSLPSQAWLNNCQTIRGLGRVQGLALVTTLGTCPRPLPLRKQALHSERWTCRSNAPSTPRPVEQPWGCSCSESVLLLSCHLPLLCSPSQSHRAERTLRNPQAHTFILHWGNLGSERAKAGCRKTPEGKSQSPKFPRVPKGQGILEPSRT